MDAWISHCGRNTRPSADCIGLLAQAGVNIVDAAPGVPALFFFDGPDADTCTALRALRDSGHERILALAARAVPPLEDTWRLLNDGAADVFAWRDAPEDATAVAARLARWHDVETLLSSPLITGSLVGRSRHWLAVLRQIVEVARFTSASALILGESGTGKELVARLMHTIDARPDKGNFVVLDCTTIVPELSGSEFFGHERGAFTGAVSMREGAFGLARGGTLFLDEVGELPLALQGQLLRAVQERTFKRVGGNAWFDTDFRLVCATNRDLAAAVRRGEFRHDLYHRIANWVFTLPALRERSEDVVPLARHFIRQRRGAAGALAMDATVEDCLMRREYPGNVRELRQLVMRIMDRHVGDGAITVGALPLPERPAAGASTEWRTDEFLRSIRLALARGVGLKDIGRAAEDCAIGVALAEADGNLQRAATRLGVTDRALQMRRASARATNGRGAQPQQVPEASA